MTHDLGFLVFQELRNQAGTAVADHFRGAVAENALRTSIPGQQHAIPGFAENSGVRGLNQCSKQLRMAGYFRPAGALGLLRGESDLKLRRPLAVHGLKLLAHAFFRERCLQCTDDLDQLRTEVRVVPGWILRGHVGLP